jgi:hypothetical protein
MRKLQEAKELANRLAYFDYHSEAFNETNAKFGEIIRKETESEGGYRVFDLYWPDDKAAHKHLKRRNDYWQAKHDAEKDRFFLLLNKHLHHWWD